MSRHLSLSLALAAALLASFSGTAAASNDAASDNTLMVCGQADIKALRFIHVGEATLLRPHCDQPTTTLTAPLSLQFDYQHSIPASAFRRAGAEMIERNISQTELDGITERLERFQQGYRDIEPGDRYTLRYLTDGRLQMWLNNELLTEQHGDDLARAYLSIWFGERPYSTRMKQALLGQR